MNKIKILISTDSAALHSGLGETVRNIFIPLLQKYPNKYDISQLGFFHFNAKEGAPWPIYPTKTINSPKGVVPDMDDKYGEKSFDEVVRHVKPDIVFGYGDLWHFLPTIHSTYRNMYRLLTYYTVDGAPYFGHLEANGSTQWGDALSKVDQIVTLSHFGKNTLLKGCPEIANKDIKVLYHPIPIQRFMLPSKEDKLKIKKSLLPAIIADEGFICGFIGRNQFRKQNYKLWEFTHYMVHGDYIQCNSCNRVTIKEWDYSSRCSKSIDELTLYEEGYDYGHCWHCKSGDIRAGEPNGKFYIWMHTPKDDPGYNMELHQRIWKISSNVIYSSSQQKRISPEEIAMMIASFDAMYYPSGGEGFGNPAFEAIASGVPVVYSNYSAHAEFCRHGGLPVRVGNYISEIHHGIQRSVVDTNHAIEQMLKLVNSEDLRNSLGKSGREFASHHDLPIMVESWDMIFNDMMTKPLPIQTNKIYAGAL